MQDGSDIPRILGMATSIPRDKTDILDMGIDEYNVRRIVKLTGIRYVRCAPQDMTGLDYCLDASRRLLFGLNFPVEEIDGVIFSTPYPDYIFPGNCSIIHSKLHLRKNCFAMDIRHSCTGLIYGLHLANILVKNRTCHNVLVCCGYTATKHLHPKDRALRKVIGDGGAAALVTIGGQQEMAVSFCYDGDGLEYLYIPAGGDRLPLQEGITDVESVDAEGNVRTLSNEYINGLEVIRFVLNDIPPLIDEVLEKQGWKKSDVDCFAVHQASKLIVSNLARAAKIEKNKAPFGCYDIGNIGGASLAIPLCQIAGENTVDLKKVVMVTYGAGLAGAVMAADLSDALILPVYEI